MAEVLLFHHALGLTDGVLGFAERLRGAGHVVHAPDLFDGHVFETVEDGVAYEEGLGWSEMVGRTERAAVELPADVVYLGMSLGAVYATRLAMTREGARGLVSFYAAIPPSALELAWPTGVPAQTHQTEQDPWRESESDAAFTAEVPGAEMFLYPGAGHLFADDASADYDAAAAEIAFDRVLTFLAELR